MPGPGIRRRYPDGGARLPCAGEVWQAKLHWAAAYKAAQTSAKRTSIAVDLDETRLSKHRHSLAARKGTSACILPRHFGYADDYWRVR